MAELHIQDKKDFEQLLIPPCSYWQEAKKLFSTEEIGTMPTWVTTVKNQHNLQWNMFTWVIDTTTFSDLKQVAYKIVENHFNNNCENPLLYLVKGIAGSGKSYVIDALRNLLQTNCWVLQWKSIDRMSVESHYTLCLNYQLAQKGSMTAKEQLSINFKVTLKMWNTY